MWGLIRVKMYNKFNTKKISIFLIISLISAFIFEEYPRTLRGVEHIYELAGFPVIFVLWYGVVLLISYFLFYKKEINPAMTFGITFGIFVESFIFHTMNFVSFFLFIILYGSMFYVPHKASHMIFEKEKISKKEIMMLLLTNLFAVIVMVILA